MNSVADAFFFGLAGVLTLAWLWRELPLQYVLTVLLVTAGISAAAWFALKVDGWWLPLILLNSRGVSRYVLYKWHERAYYGWWVIGLTCALSSIPAPHWSTPILSLAMQLAATPWLIKRKPGTDAPQWIPLTTWLLLSAFLIFYRDVRL